MGRLAMVTGASSGIGEGCAELLAEDGWDFVLVARRRDRLEDVAARLEAEHGISVRLAEIDLANDDTALDPVDATQGTLLGLTHTVELADR